MCSPHTARISNYAVNGLLICNSIETDFTAYHTVSAQLVVTEAMDGYYAYL